MTLCGCKHTGTHHCYSGHTDHWSGTCFWSLWFVKLLCLRMIEKAMGLAWDVTYEQGRTIPRLGLSGHWGDSFPGDAVVKNLPAMQETRRSEFDPCVGKIPWKRKWQPTPVFLPGKFHAQRSIAGYSPWDHRVRHNWTRTQAHTYEEKLPWVCNQWTQLLLCILQNTLKENPEHYSQDYSRPLTLNWTWQKELEWSISQQQMSPPHLI